MKKDFLFERILSNDEKFQSINVNINNKYYDYFSGCAVLQNTLYVIGGCFNQTDSLSTLTEHVHPFGFAYNPRKDSWARISPMNRERCRFTLIPCGKDKLVAIGGSGKAQVRIP